MLAHNTDLYIEFSMCACVPHARLVLDENGLSMDVHPSHFFATLICHIASVPRELCVRAKMDTKDSVTHASLFWVRLLVRPNSD